MEELGSVKDLFLIFSETGRVGAFKNFVLNWEGLDECELDAGWRGFGGVDPPQYIFFVFIASRRLISITDVVYNNAIISYKNT